MIGNRRAFSLLQRFSWTRAPIASRRAVSGSARNKPKAGAGLCIIPCGPLKTSARDNTIIACGYPKRTARDNLLSRAAHCRRPLAMVGGHISPQPDRPLLRISSGFSLLNIHKLGGKVFDLKSLIGFHIKGVELVLLLHLLPFLSVFIGGIRRNLHFYKWNSIDTFLFFIFFSKHITIPLHVYKSI